MPLLLKTCLCKIILSMHILFPLSLLSNPLESSSGHLVEWCCTCNYHQVTFNDFYQRRAERDPTLKGGNKAAPSPTTWLPNNNSWTTEILHGIFQRFPVLICEHQQVTICLSKVLLGAASVFNRLLHFYCMYGSVCVLMWHQGINQKKSVSKPMNYWGMPPEFQPAETGFWFLCHVVWCEK